MWRFVIAAAVVLLSVAAAAAEVVPGRWEKVQALPADTEVWVTLQSGERVQGWFVKLNDAHLVLAGSGGARLELHRSHIQKITGPRKPRRRFWTGAKTGALAGFGMGMAIGLAAGDDGIWCDITAEGAGIFLGGMLAGPGAIAGRVLENSARRPDVYYQAVFP